MAVIAGINYQGRDGELHIIDNTNASATTNATPWGLKVRFSQMDFNTGFQARPDELTRLDRQKLTTDAHLQIGSEENLFTPVNATFSAVMSSLETDALMQMVGIDYAQLPGGATSAPGNSWNVKGTPTGNVGLVSTKSRPLTGSGRYSGGRIDGKGSAVALPNFADPKKVAVDVEVMWARRDSTQAFGYRLKEVHFAPGQQKIAESADFVTMTLTGMMYGEMTRITSFTTAMDILQGGSTGAAVGGTVLLPTTPNA